MVGDLQKSCFKMPVLASSMQSKKQNYKINLAEIAEDFMYYSYIRHSSYVFKRSGRIECRL